MLVGLAFLIKYGIPAPARSLFSQNTHTHAHTRTHSLTLGAVSSTHSDHILVCRYDLAQRDNISSKHVICLVDISHVRGLVLTLDTV